MLKRALPRAALLLVPLLLASALPAAPPRIWDHGNLYAWCLVPFDAKKRGPEERAAMLEQLGFPAFAYDWREKDVPTFDAEIDALARHHIQLLSWWFPIEARDPLAQATLETFRRHGVHPQLWATMGQPLEFHPARLPQTPQEQAQCVSLAAERIRALVELARPYGCRVELYNHNHWFGLEDNELAVLAQLRSEGVTDVGLVYNFSHARDSLHDDTKGFAQLWPRIEPYVVAVNVTGLHWEGQHVYPSQGDQEQAMMRVIEQSGWRGPVGLIAEMGGDAAVTLARYRTGLDWLAAEIVSPGSGGPAPFPAVKAP